MDCDKAKEMMNELLDGDLDEVGRHLLDQHLVECEACARQQEEMRAIEQWARDLRPASPRASFARRVMARVEAEQPVYETSTAGIEIIIAFVLTAAAVPTFLIGSDALYDWLVAASASMGDLFQSVVGELADAGSQAFASVGALWSAMGQWQWPLSPTWMMLVATTAFVAMVVFNVVQARTAAQRT
jgi:predicted anti-sigma-YlaC factor YlaD